MLLTNSCHWLQLTSHASSHRFSQVSLFQAQSGEAEKRRFHNFHTDRVRCRSEDPAWKSARVVLNWVVTFISRPCIECSPALLLQRCRRVCTMVTTCRIGQRSKFEVTRSKMSIGVVKPTAQYKLATFYGILGRPTSFDAVDMHPEYVGATSFF